MSLDPNKKKVIIDSLKKYGIVNPFLQAGILAVVYKESNFVPQSENLNYTAKRISEVWKKIPLEVAKTLEHNPEKLGNFVYGGKYGNNANEGYKYRGRGLNQLTFKDNYKLIGDLINKDLVSYPDQLNDFKTSSEAVAVYFKKNIDLGIKKGKFKKFSVTSIDQIKNIDSGLKVAIQTNAGLNTDFNNNIIQEGYKRALSIVKDLFKDLDVKKTISGASIFALIVGAYFFFKRK
jgi:predicted chitinase